MLTISPKDPAPKVETALIVPPVGPDAARAGTDEASPKIKPEPKPTIQSKGEHLREHADATSPKPAADHLLIELLRYLSRTEVHTYAFSVAANAILSLFPFVVLLLTIAHRFFHSRQMVNVIGIMIRALLPTGQEFVVRNMIYLVYSQKK